MPINICYDRLFESINIATEMISGKNRFMGIYEAIFKLGNFNAGQFGNVFVKCLKPIKVSEFLE